MAEPYNWRHNCRDSVYSSSTITTNNSYKHRTTNSRVFNNNREETSPKLENYYSSETATVHLFPGNNAHQIRSNYKYTRKFSKYNREKSEYYENKPFYKSNTAEGEETSSVSSGRSSNSSDSFYSCSSKPCQRSSFHRNNSKISDKNIKFLPNAVNVQHLSSPVTSNDTDITSVNIPSEEFKKLSYLRNYEDFRQASESISSSQIVIDFRNLLNNISEESVGSNLMKINKIKHFIKTNPSLANLYELHLENLKCQERTYTLYVSNIIKKLDLTLGGNVEETVKNVFEIKKSVEEESMLFKKSFPAYSLKNSILDAVQKSQVAIILSDPTYFFNVVTPIIVQNEFLGHNIISCENSKIACEWLQNTITDISSEKRHTIEFMTQEQTLDNFRDNKFIKDFICVMHIPLRRSIICELLLHQFCYTLQLQQNCKLVILLSIVDDKKVYEDYFQQFSPVVIQVPKLLLPVKTIWKSQPNVLSHSFNYIEEIVTTAISAHVLNRPGNILVFNPSLNDAELAIASFKAKVKNIKCNEVECVLVHKDSIDLYEKNCNSCSEAKRIIFFTTSFAEVLNFPNVSYVIDCGMRKRNAFDVEKKTNVLTLSFNSRSSAKLRKHLVGIYNFGTCYRIYNKSNFCNMKNLEIPDMHELNPENSLLELMKYLPETALRTRFIDTFDSTAMSYAVKQLTFLNALRNKQLTPLGKSLLKLPYSAKYSKLIYIGIEWGYAYESIILVAFFLVGSFLFDYSKDTKKQREIDAAKLQLMQHDSDSLTYLHVYKSWVENKFSVEWCRKHFLNIQTLSEVKAKIAEIAEDVIECLNETIEEAFNYNEDYENSIKEMLFQCFGYDMCVFTGHYRSGYRIVSSQTSVFIHPSSVLHCTKNLPQSIIFTNMHSSSRLFLLEVTSIPDEIKNKFVKRKLLDFDLCDAKSLASEDINHSVGERFIKQVLCGKQGKKLMKLEESLKRQLKTDLIVIDPDAEKGCITAYALEQHLSYVVDKLKNMIKQYSEDLLNEKETYTLELSKGDNCVFLPITFLKGGIILSIDFEQLVHDAKTNKASTQANVRDSLIHNSINLTWIRRPCTGVGYITFEGYQFTKAQELAKSGIHILGTKVNILISKKDKNQLFMPNLPNNAQTSDIEFALSEYLPDYIKPRRIELKYSSPFETTDSEIEDIKQTIQQLCSKCSKLTQYDVVIPKPKNTATKMIAYINVYSETNLTEASKFLCGKSMFNFKIDAKPVYSLIVKCNKSIFEAVELQLNALKKSQTSCLLTFNSLKADVSIKIQSNKMISLQECQRKVNDILQGELLTKENVRDIFKLFCHGGHMWLRTVQNASKNLYIYEDYNSKTIRIYGSKSDCFLVRMKIIDFLKKAENEEKETIILSSDKKGRRMLKAFIKKYGVHLERFIEFCHLRSANLNIKTSQLFLYGSNESIRKAQECLQDLAYEIDMSSEAVIMATGEQCPGCDSTLNLTFRLQSCGHLYCNECILNLIEQQNFPLQCTKANCYEDIVIDDIKRILADDENKIKKLLRSSLSDYLQKNQTRIEVCPVPDCSMFYYKNNVSNKWKCPLCQNEICTRCKVVYHEGITCDIYQGTKKDPDYSLKLYLDTKLCKRCPRCSVPIEKNEGCDHMTCTRCSAHFCWVCGREFPNELAVYNHIPFCDKYPKW